MNLKFQSLCPLLSVYDMDIALKFYCDILGFKIHLSAGPDHDIGWVWLKSDELDLMLNTQNEAHERPKFSDPLRHEIHGDTIIYIGSSDVDGLYEYLASKIEGLKRPSIAPYGMKQLYLLDPDGYTICFQSRFPSNN